MEARASILVIDSVELLQGERIHPRLRKNSPETAFTLVSRWLDSVTKDTLLLCIVPVKTETWLRQRLGHDHIKAGELLHQTILTQYDKMLRALAQHKSRVAVVLCPVQTVGNLVFGHFQPKRIGYPTPVWKKVRGTRTAQQSSAGYAPLDCDQPLQHILNWVLVQEINKRRAETQTEWSKFWQDFWTWVDEDMGDMYVSIRHALIDVFGQDRDHAKAVAKFVAGAKLTPPFQIVQGEDIIKRESIFWDAFID